MCEIYELRWLSLQKVMVQVKQGINFSLHERRFSIWKYGRNYSRLCQKTLFVQSSSQVGKIHNSQTWYNWNQKCPKINNCQPISLRYLPSNLSCVCFKSFQDLEYITRFFDSRKIIYHNSWHTEVQYRTPELMKGSRLCLPSLYPPIKLILKVPKK